MGTRFVTEGGCKYICKDMGWMWMENGPDSEITKFSKIIKYIKKEVCGACFECGLPTFSHLVHLTQHQS